MSSSCRPSLVLGVTSLPCTTLSSYSSSSQCMFECDCESLIKCRCTDSMMDTAHSSSGGGHQMEERLKLSPPHGTNERSDARAETLTCTLRAGHGRATFVHCTRSLHSLVSIQYARQRVLACRTTLVVYLARLLCSHGHRQRRHDVVFCRGHRRRQVVGVADRVGPLATARVRREAM